jgi:putative flippase GtrA
MNATESPGNALSAQGMRFLVFGAINTALTYLLYCALVLVMHPQLAYALAFALGIVLAWAGNSKFVFRRPLTRKTGAVYPFMYVAQYLLTAALIHAFTTWLSMGPRIALAIALVITTPLSFLWNRALLARRTEIQ